LTGCEYGDRHVTYCSERLRSDCYDVNVNQTCCASCAAQRNTDARDCQFGDKASWCHPSQFQPHSCYSSADTCCETCADYRTGPPGETTALLHEPRPFVDNSRKCLLTYFHLANCLKLGIEQATSMYSLTFRVRVMLP